jgi:hypothetical protein
MLEQYQVRPKVSTPNIGSKQKSEASLAVRLTKQIPTRATKPAPESFKKWINDVGSNLESTHADEVLNYRL